MANHLTMEERDLLAQRRHQGASQQAIAQALGRSRSTISRELKRNRTDGAYLAAQAQRQSEQRRRDRPLERKLDDPQINAFVREGLTYEWSPEQITGRLKEQHSDRSVSPQTIYTWIKGEESRQHWETFLRRRGKRPNRRRKTAPRGSAIGRKSSKYVCGWATSKAIRSSVHRAPAAWRPSSVASRG